MGLEGYPDMAPVGHPNKDDLNEYGDNEDGNPSIAC